MGTPWGPQGVGRERNATETPQSHPGHSIPMFPWKELDITGGQSPCDTGTDRAGPRQPHAAASVPNKGAIQLWWRGAQHCFRCCPAPRTSSQEKGPSCPQGCKGPADKRSRWAQERRCAQHWLQALSPRWAPLRLMGPCRWTDSCPQVCSAWPFPRVDPSEGLGWGNARRSGSQGAVMLLVIPRHVCHPQHHQTTITPTYRSGKFFLPAPAGEAAAAKICLALPSLPVPSA